MISKRYFGGVNACLVSILLLLWPSVEFKESFGADGVMHANDPVLSDSSGFGQFSVLTYNIAGLPEIISSAKTRRAPSIATIGERINQFDIVHVQEDFNYHDALYQKGNKHLYRTKTKGGIPFGDGLSTLSRFPISAVQRVPWIDCTGADCLTPKGFTFSRIQVAQHSFIDFYNIHSNAFNDPKAARARRANIEQLSAFIQKNSADHAVIVMGDLNGRYSFAADNIQNLLINNGLQDAWVLLNRNGQLPTPSAALPKKDIMHLTNDSESIDKILFRGSKNLVLTPSDYNLQSRIFANEAGTPLSDHLPVSLMFSWKTGEMATDLIVKR